MKHGGLQGDCGYSFGDGTLLWDIVLGSIRMHALKGYLDSN